MQGRSFASLEDDGNFPASNEAGEFLEGLSKQSADSPHCPLPLPTAPCPLLTSLVAHTR